MEPFSIGDYTRMSIFGIISYNEEPRRSIIAWMASSSHRPIVFMHCSMFNKNHSYNFKVILCSCSYVVFIDEP